MTIIPSIRGLKQENCEFQANLSYVVMSAHGRKVERSKGWTNKGRKQTILNTLMSADKLREKVHHSLHLEEMSQGFYFLNSFFKAENGY